MPFSHRCVAVVTALNGDSVCLTIAHHCVGAEVFWSQTGVLISSVLVARHCEGVTDLLGGVGFGVTFVNILVAHYCGGVPIFLNGLGVASDIGGSSGHAPH